MYTSIDQPTTPIAARAQAATTSAGCCSCDTTLRLIATRRHRRGQPSRRRRARRRLARLDDLLVRVAPGDAARGARALRAGRDRVPARAARGRARQAALAARGWSTQFTAPPVRPARRGAVAHCRRSTRCSQEAARDPELERVCREWTAAWDEALARGLRVARRVRAPELEARMFLAMLDGLLIDELATPDEDVEQHRHPARPGGVVLPRTSNRNPDRRSARDTPLPNGASTAGRSLSPVCSRSWRSRAALVLAACGGDDGGGGLEDDDDDVDGARSPRPRASPAAN